MRPVAENRGDSQMIGQRPGAGPAVLNKQQPVPCLSHHVSRVSATIELRATELCFRLSRA